MHCVFKNQFNFTFKHCIAGPCLVWGTGLEDEDERQKLSVLDLGGHYLPGGPGVQTTHNMLCSIMVRKKGHRSTEQGVMHPA